MYELSGWVKAENTKSLHNGWGVRTYYYAKNTSGAYSLMSHATSAMRVSPWQGKNGDQDWTYFATLPLANDAIAEYSILLQPRIEGSKTVASGGWIGDILFADLSMHEVQYDRMEFTAAGAVSGRKATDTVKTAAKHYSTTGQEIKYLTFLTESAGVPATADGAAPVRYTTSDPFVARVDEAGVITAVGGGEAVITASATIGGITHSQQIAVTVTGAPASKELASVSLSLTPDTINQGESAAAQVTGLMTDNFPAFLEDAEIRYSYDEELVSFDAENSAFTGLKPGTAEIAVSVTLLGHTKTDTASLTVRPPTLTSAALRYGSDVLPAGSELSPEVSGKHDRWKRGGFERRGV